MANDELFDGSDFNLIDNEISLLRKMLMARDDEIEHLQSNCDNKDVQIADAKRRIAELESAWAACSEQLKDSCLAREKCAERIATLTEALEKARDALDKTRELLKYDLNVVEAISVIDEALK